jgi:hypothetical protein
MVQFKEGTNMKERSLILKIYLFDPENGLYQGEDFADDTPMCPGRDAVPRDATTIAPPSYGRGEVPVFNLTEQQWRIRSVSSVLACR